MTVTLGAMERRAVTASAMAMPTAAAFGGLAMWPIDFSDRLEEESAEPVTGRPELAKRETRREPCR